jgi:hypothetical protein
MGAELPKDESTLPPLSEVLPITDDLYERSETYLRTLPPETFLQPLPHRKDHLIPPFIQTLADALEVFPVHEGHHTGEISLLRRLLGKGHFM